MMKRILLLLGFVFAYSINMYAQPANNACANAISLGTVSTTTTTTGTNAAATSDQTAPSCFSWSKNVWYKFTVPAGGGSYNVAINANALTNPDVVVFSGSFPDESDTSVAHADELPGNSVFQQSHSRLDAYLLFHILPDLFDRSDA